MKFSFFIFTLLFSITISAQESSTDPFANPEDLPYQQIPEAPQEFSQTNVVARMIDGLGFRYYWATQDLREEDLNYSPGNEGRPAGETLEHLFGLSNMIWKATTFKPNVRPSDAVEMTFAERRKATLMNLHRASTNLKAADPAQLEHMTIKFQRGENTSEVPFWNLLNGPLADALTHVGQIVSYRRSSGNPIYPGVNVFMGTAK